MKVRVDKNHNPRKGTETVFFDNLKMDARFDKNHNPRKGTETFSSFIDVSKMARLKIRTIIPARGRKLFGS